MDDDRFAPAVTQQTRMLNVDISYLNMYYQYIQLHVEYTYGESLLSVDLDHAAQQALAVWRHEVRNVKDAALDLLQQVT